MTTMMDLVQAEGRTLRRSGDHWVTLCLRHIEKSPSMHVWKDHVHCFGCGYHAHISEFKSIGAVAPVKIEREARPKIDVYGMMGRWRRATTDAMYRALADRLGVALFSAVAIGGVWAPEHKAWAFPMCNGRGQYVGIRLRSDDGKKWAVSGSRSGLFMDRRMTSKELRLWVCEGPTDTMAALSLGLNAVGRPSCSDGVFAIVDLVKAQAIREVIIVADGDTPGVVGAQRLQASLPCASCVWLPEAKDLREYIQVAGVRQIEDEASQCLWRDFVPSGDGLSMGLTTQSAGAFGAGRGISAATLEGTYQK